MAEPLRLDEAKQQLGIVDDTQWDALIAGYIVAARAYVEKRGNRILVEGSYSETFDRFSAYLELTGRPIIDGTSVSYTDSDGVAQAISDVVATTSRYPVRVFPAYNSWWPSVRTNTPIIVTYHAGYTEEQWTTEPDAICLIQAMRILIASWFANRENVILGTSMEAPHSVDALCDQVRGALL